MAGSPIRGSFPPDERAAFRRRYSRKCAEFASHFAHDHVWVSTIAITAIMAATTNSKQRRNLRHLERAEQHRAVGEAQRKSPRLLAFEHGFGTERVDPRGDADIGVLFDGLAEAGNGAVQ